MPSNIPFGKNSWVQCEYISMAGDQCDVFFQADGNPLCPQFHRDPNGDERSFVEKVNEHREIVALMTNDEIEAHRKMVDAACSRFIQESKIKLWAIRQITAERRAALTEAERRELRKQQVNVRSSSSSNGKPKKEKETKEAKLASQFGLNVQDMLKLGLEDMKKKYQQALEQKKGTDDEEPNKE
jgi:predicted DNA-binding ArsR family transcriptional regulator